jgi:hypothetical protein
MTNKRTGKGRQQDREQDKQQDRQRHKATAKYRGLSTTAAECAAFGRDDVSYRKCEMKMANRKCEMKMANRKCEMKMAKGRGGVFPGKDVASKWRNRFIGFSGIPRLFR